MNTKNKHNIASTVTALSLFMACATMSYAGQATVLETTVVPSAPVVSGSVGVNAVSGYVFRGQILDSNLAYQPNLTLSLPIDLSFTGVDSSKLQLNTTQSFNQNTPNNGWFRSEVEVGVALTKGVFVVTPSYQYFNSPIGNFSSSQGVGVKVNLKEGTSYGLNPYTKAFFGTKGNANNGTNTGSYYEVGVAPSAKVGTTVFSLPVAVGFGAGNYYAQNAGFGFTTVGLHSVTPITNNLNFTAGVDYWRTNKEINTNRDTVSTSVGLSLTF
jgi:hypothetical protein